MENQENENVAAPVGGAPAPVGGVVDAPAEDAAPAEKTPEEVAAQKAADDEAIAAHQAKLAEEAEAAKKAEEEAAAGATRVGVADAGEPRKRFRGHVVISEEPRTVEEQTFQHIRLDDGSELDLTEAEYRTEVHVSYPPQA